MCTIVTRYFKSCHTPDVINDTVSGDRFHFDIAREMSENQAQSCFFFVLRDPKALSYKL